MITTMGIPKPATIAAMSWPGVLIGAPWGASLMLVSSPLFMCESVQRQRYSNDGVLQVPRSSSSFLMCPSSTVDYRRNVYCTAHPAGLASARVNPDLTGVGERLL